jgi:hypothetical protein
MNEPGAGVFVGGRAVGVDKSTGVGVFVGNRGVAVARDAGFASGMDEVSALALQANIKNIARIKYKGWKNFLFIIALRIDCMEKRSTIFAKSDLGRSARWHLALRHL